ncbi:MAG: PorV/PorQ family protein, partial [Flammeovirgaceae bacterium]|nr:PorV/PorQ family protein [Flammeovirgaceae bacterium]
MIQKLLIVIWVVQAGSVLAQTKSFDFLNVPPSARQAALGGVNVSLTDRDISLFLSNPTLASDSMARFFTANYLFYVADVGQASFGYAHPFRKAGVITFGVQHLEYGDLQSYDASGAELGSFKSSETALVIGKSFQSGVFRFGVNAKMIFSNLAGYRASAMAFDLGGLFVHPEKQMTVGL